MFLNDLTWDSYGPYYMQRRALMNYDKWPLSNPKLQKAIDLTGIESITAASIKNPSQELLELFQLVPVPIFADIYLRGDLYARAYQRLFDVDLNGFGPCFPAARHVSGQHLWLVREARRLLCPERSEKRRPGSAPNCSPPRNNSCLPPCMRVIVGTARKRYSLFFSLHPRSRV